jgi:DNA-binding CsgD family transcriptional regulator
VFSIEDKSYRIKSLFNNLGINAYVSKGRNSIPELKNALETVFKTDDKNISPGLALALKDKSLHEIEAYDISLLKLLSTGCILNEISEAFKNTGITPNGSSSIEKRINKLKIYFKANNNVHLIAIAKDLGLV